MTSILASCSSKLSYFTMEPYAKPFDKKVNKTLYIVLNDDVKDSFELRFGQKFLTVTQFRKSLAASMKITFSKNFSEVKFIEKKSDTGLCIVVFRVKPSWSVGSSGNYKSSNHSDHDGGEIVSNFEFESSLYYMGEKLNADDGACTSTVSSRNVGFDLPPIFRDGVRVFCEQLNSNLFTDSVLQKIK